MRAKMRIPVLFMGGEWVPVNEIIWNTFQHKLYTAISYFPVKASLPSALRLFKDDSQLVADGLCFLF